MSRTDRIFLAMLPILTGPALQELATEWPDLKTQSNRTEDCAIELSEAARNANIEFVRTLLPMHGYTQSDLKDTLIAASSCCDEALLDLLITHIAKRCKDFHWPPALLCRVAQFGQGNVVKLLLKCGASLEAAVTLQKMTPLYLAARHGHVEVVKLLLDNEASLTALDETV